MAVMAKKKSKIYSVSQVNSLIKTVLEENLPSRMLVNGEITDWKPHQSGHCYFSLKDENSTLPCVMWKSRVEKIKFQLENGLAVLASGFIDLYIPHGRYKFMVGKLEPAGVGALQLAFEQMVSRLESEGLFSDEHKKPLPRYPQRIGILTSELGAAIVDIKDSIHNRWPCAKLFLYPVPVQGEGAAQSIAAALKDVNRRNNKLKLDLLIVGRGGGSLEDLWTFNEEALARAIFDSKIPIISAVGHEIDTTIADLVADARASTPTKAGFVAVPDMQEILGRLISIESRLKGDARAKVELAQQSLETICASAAFRNPLSQILGAVQRLDELDSRLLDSIKKRILLGRKGLQRSYEQVVSIEPHRLLGKRTVDLNNLKNRASQATRAAVNKYWIELTAKMNRLGGLNPKSVLKRGYSITTNKKTGVLIRNTGDVTIGDLLVTELAGENLIESKVTKK